MTSPVPSASATQGIPPTAAASPAGALPTLTPTPTGTPTLTPTDGAPLGTANQNANCRLGPGTVYHNVATLLEGQSAELVGRNAESTWWWISTPGAFGGHCWVWGGSLVIVGPSAGLRVILAPSTDTPTPGDTQGPVVDLSYAPSGQGRPTDHDKISLTANASDSGGVARIEIWFRAPGQSQASLVRSCPDTTHCSFAGGPYPAGTG